MKTICPDCQGTFEPLPGKGYSYEHVCAPLSDVQAAALARKMTVAELDISLNGATLVLNKTETELAGQSLASATAIIAAKG